MGHLLQLGRAPRGEEHRGEGEQPTGSLGGAPYPRATDDITYMRRNLEQGPPGERQEGLLGAHQHPPRRRPSREPTPGMPEGGVGSQAATPKQLGGAPRTSGPKPGPSVAGPSWGTGRPGAVGAGTDWEETVEWERLRRLHLGRDPLRNGEQAPMRHRVGGQGEGRQTSMRGMQRREGEPLAPSMGR